MMSFENALHEQRAKPSAFQLTIRPDNIGVITIDVPGDKVNTLKAEFVEQVNDVLIRAQQHTALEGLVIVSGKPDSFIAGADITMIAACTSAKEAETLAKKGQSTLAQIAAFPVPVVAAIHGACPAVGWNWRWPATAASVRSMTKPRSGCRKCSWACCRAPAVRSAYRARSAPPRRWT